MKMVHLQGKKSFPTFLVLVAMATGISDAQVDQVKTEPPPPSHPSPALSSREKKFQDCSEYRFGKLHAFRPHGTTWQNSESDCSNCTCDNGDIRCFFHFCNGPPTGYMTPPTAMKDALTTTEKDFSNRIEDLREESSGYPPFELEDTEGDEDEDFSWSFVSEEEEQSAEGRNDVVSGQDKASTTSRDHFESSGEDAVTEDPVGHALLSYAERHKEKFCSWPCDKDCPNGYKTDWRSSGCWRCRCMKKKKKKKCPERKRCPTPCPLGHLRDESGCKTCACVVLPEEDVPGEKMTDSEEGFVFDDDQMAVDVTALEGDDDVYMSDVIEDDDVTKGGRDDVTPLPPPVPLLKFLPEEDLRLLSDGDEDDGEDEDEEVFPEAVSPASHEEPCNATDPAKLGRGGAPQQNSLSKGAPKVRAEGATFSKDEPFIDIDGEQVELQDSEAEFGEEATAVKSVVEEDHSQLIMILVPMGILCALTLLLLGHFWRRYHRDKYDINSFRPEEKEILHPVRTLQEDQGSLKHV